MTHIAPDGVVTHTHSQTNSSSQRRDDGTWWALQAGGGNFQYFGAMEIYSVPVDAIDMSMRGPTWMVLMPDGKWHYGHADGYSGYVAAEGYEAVNAEIAWLYHAQSIAAGHQAEAARHVAGANEERRVADEALAKALYAAEKQHGKGRFSPLANQTPVVSTPSTR